MQIPSRLGRIGEGVGRASLSPTVSARKHPGRGKPPHVGGLPLRRSRKWFHYWPYFSVHVLFGIKSRWNWKADFILIRHPPVACQTGISGPMQYMPHRPMVARDPKEQSSRMPKSPILSWINHVLHHRCNGGCRKIPPFWAEIAPSFRSVLHCRAVLRRSSCKVTALHRSICSPCRAIAQAARFLSRFLFRATTPRAPKPRPSSGKAAGTGIAAGTSSTKVV